MPRKPKKIKYKNEKQKEAIKEELEELQSRTSELSQHPKFVKLKEKYLYPYVRDKRRSCLDNKRKAPPKHLQALEYEVMSTQNITKPKTDNIGRYRYGQHISIKNGFLGASKYAKEKGYSCFQIFLQSPRSFRFNKREITDEEANKVKKYLADNDIEMWIHSPYIINFCRRCCENTEYLRENFVDDLKRAHKLGAKGCVIHVGKLRSRGEVHVRPKHGMRNMKQNIEKCLETMIKDGYKEIPWVLIETAAGQGTETPDSIKGLSDLYYSFDVNYRKFIGFCVDTCHIFACGVCNMKEKEGIHEFIDEWNKHIGWDHVKLVHLNDSKKEFGSRVDRHAPPGEGLIGVRGMKYFRDFCVLTGKPMVVETDDMGAKF